VLSAARAIAPEPFETVMNRVYLASRPLKDAAAATPGRSLARRVGKRLSIRL
jgi:hypothetical protein